MKQLLVSSEPDQQLLVSSEPDQQVSSEPDQQVSSEPDQQLLVSSEPDQQEDSGHLCLLPYFTRSSTSRMEVPRSRSVLFSEEEERNIRGTSWTRTNTERDALPGLVVHLLSSGPGL